MSLPKEQYSQVHKQGPQVDTTLESSLNGRRRCKGNAALISQANGQRCFIALGVYITSSMINRTSLTQSQSWDDSGFFIPKNVLSGRKK